MIQCKFCLNSQAQRYVYTECDHLICINCAALRAAGQSLMCCNRRTTLDNSVIAELTQKKLSIMSNLQNEYQYEKGEKDRISFDQIERKLSMINIEDGKKTKRPVTQPVITVNGSNLMNVGNDDEIYIDNSSEPNHKVFQRSSRQTNAYHDVQTPIRMISNPSAIMQVQSQYGNSSQQWPSSNKPSQLKSQLVKMKHSPFSLQECKPLLEAQLDVIKLQFQSLHQALRKVESEMVMNLKIYFQEYVKLIQNDYEIGAIGEESVGAEKERITGYLEMVVGQSKLQDIKGVVMGGDGGKGSGEGVEKVVEKSIGGGVPSVVHEQKSFQNQRKVVFNKPSETQPLPLPLQSRRVQNFEPRSRHQGSSNSKAHQSSQSFFQKLHLNTMREHFHNVEIESIAPAASTNRNLDKIYRKLQESRSKLQQRIQLHSEFVNKRATKMSNM